MPSNRQHFLRTGGEVKGADLSISVDEHDPTSEIQLGGRDIERRLWMSLRGFV